MLPGCGPKRSTSPTLLRWPSPAGPALPSALAPPSDSDYEAVQGVTPTAQAALMMRRYLHETGAPPDAMAGFSLVAHSNAVGNPFAMYRRAIKPEDYGRAGT